MAMKSMDYWVDMYILSNIAANISIALPLGGIPFTHNAVRIKRGAVRIKRGRCISHWFESWHFLRSRD